MNAATRLAHQPALDGLRGLAVMLVLGFHLELEWLSGGYLGVSVFFTLSGFLITSLLLAEREGTGRIDLPRFVGRRVRRLMPASTACLIAVLAAVAVGWLDAPSTLRSEILGSLFQVVNWVELSAQRSYADLFLAPSPVAHFWSLSIEEQFYLLWPLTMVLVASRLRGTRLVGVFAAWWVVASVSAVLTARWWSPAAAYYATWARAPELLTGAILAAWVAARRSTAARHAADQDAPGRPTGSSSPRRQMAGQVVAACAAAVVVVASVLTPAGRGWAFQGLLPLFGVVSAVLIAGLQTAGPVTALFASRPLTYLGRISYGVYLHHWPVFLVLDGARTGLDGAPLHLLRLAVTFALAEASFTFLERPIRERRRLVTTPRLAQVLGSSAALVVVGAFVVLPSTSGAPGDIPDVLGSLPTVPATVPATVPVTGPPTGTGDGPAASSTVPPTTAPPGPAVVAIFGDSVPAWLLRDAAVQFDRTDVVVVNGAQEGCDGMVDLPLGRDRFGAELRPPPECRTWDMQYPAVLDTLPAPADAVVLMIGQAPLLDRQVDGVWRGPCDGIGWYLDDLDRRLALLDDRGEQVVVALPAPPGERSIFSNPVDFEARMACIRAELIPHLAAAGVPTVDMVDVLCPGGDCDALRSQDGVHVDPDRAPGVLDWVLDAVLDR